MSYSAFENSKDSGSVVELYEFVQGTQRFYYSSSENPIAFNGFTYDPFSAKRNSIKQTNDVFKDSMALTFPRSDAFAKQFLGFAPEDVTTLTIRRGHYGDVANEFITYWKGRVVGAKTSDNHVTIDYQSTCTTIKRPGLRARFEYTCLRTLYSRSCSVNKELYRLNGLVTTVAGAAVTVSGCSLMADGFYTGGLVISDSGATRFVISHIGDNLILSRPISGLVGNTTMVVYPGCDHLKETCLAKFNNLNNFGGFPWIPSRNPFDGSSIV